MIVYDVTDQVSFNNTKQWLKEIDRFAVETVNKILVGNKCDLENQRAVGYNTAKEFASDLQLTYVETSAKDSTNVDRAYETFASEIKGLMAPLYKEELEYDNRDSFPTPLSTQKKSFF